MFIANDVYRQRCLSPTMFMVIYFVPFLLDFLLFFVMLRVADAAGREMQLSNSQASALTIAFSVGYMILCPVAGRVLNGRTTKPILIFSILAIGFCSVPLLWTTAFWPALVFITLLGAGAALAFNAFQALVRDQTPHGDLAQMVARYTLAWSSGIGLGFLCSGILRAFNQPLLMAISCVVVCSALIGLVVWQTSGDTVSRGIVSGDTLSTRLGAQANTQASTRRIEAAHNLTQKNLISYDGRYDARYIAIAWSLLLAANFVQRPLTVFLPKFSAQAGNPSWMAGALLATTLLTQALVGFTMQGRTFWLYRRKPLVVLQIGMVVVLGALWLSHHYVLSLFLMACLGALHGFTYFASVYLASNSTHSARNIGINETMVGVGNIAGMMCSDAAIRIGGFERAFFSALIIFSALLVVWQIWWLRPLSNNALSKNALKN